MFLYFAERNLFRFCTKSNLKSFARQTAKSTKIAQGLSTYTEHIYVLSLCECVCVASRPQKYVIIFVFEFACPLLLLLLLCRRHCGEFQFQLQCIYDIPLRICYICARLSRHVFNIKFK